MVAILLNEDVSIVAEAVVPNDVELWTVGCGNSVKFIMKRALNGYDTPR